MVDESSSVKTRDAENRKTRASKENVETEVEGGKRVCPECSGDVKQEDNEVICTDCGLVIEEDQIDPGPEWRAFNHTEQQQKSRVGSPTTQTMHDKGLTTTIDWKDKDAYGRQITADKRAQMSRLRNWQERIRTKDAGERNLQFALSEIDRMASALGLTENVREFASVLYRRALEEDLVRGRSIEGVATACLYATCRQESLPRSLEEIEEVSRVEKKEIGRTYRYLSQELGLEMEPVDPTEYVPRFCSDLDLSSTVESKAEDIINRTAEKGLLSGKSPTGFAAAAIYAASLLCNEKRTQSEVAEVAQVTEVTIRNRYQEQIKAVEIV